MLMIIYEMYINTSMYNNKGDVDTLPLAIACNQ